MPGPFIRVREGDTVEFHFKNSPTSKNTHTVDFHAMTGPHGPGHTWMSAYVFVTDPPYYALTDANGSFKIDGVPLGNYEIEVWQEWLGKTRQPITVAGEKTEPVTLTLKEPPKQ